MTQHSIPQQHQTNEHSISTLMNDTSHEKDNKNGKPLETTQILDSPSSHSIQPENICLHKDSASIIPESGIRENQEKWQEHSFQLAANTKHANHKETSTVQNHHKKDVCSEMEIEFPEDRPPSIPPPLPTKQLVHITNFPLGDDNSLTIARQSESMMDIDISDESKLIMATESGNANNCDIMDVCTEGPNAALPEPNEVTSQVPKYDINTKDTKEHNMDKKNCVGSDSSTNPTVNFGFKPTILVGSKNDDKTALINISSMETTSSYKKDDATTDLVKEEKVNDNPHRDKCVHPNSLNRKYRCMDENMMDDNSLNNINIGPNYAKEKNTIFDSNTISTISGDNKETLSIHHLKDSNLTQALSYRPVLETRDDSSTYAGAEKDKKDYDTKNVNKKDQEQCIVESRIKGTKNTTNTSQTFTTSSKIIQSRPTSLSSTSPNTISAQSLFLTTPIPYSKPTNFLSTANSYLPTDSISAFESLTPNITVEKSSIAHSSEIQMCNNSHSNRHEKIDIPHVQKDSNSHALNSMSQPTDFNTKSVDKDTEANSKQSINNINLIKSRFESMDCSDTGSEKESFSTSEQYSSEDSTSQPNSLSSGCVQMNLSNTPIENADYGSTTSKGLSQNNANPKNSRPHNSIIGSSLSKNRKSSSMYRSTDGGHQKLSAVSLQDVDDRIKKVISFGDQSDSTNEEDEDIAPLQRRNSIHNVPYVNVNDPDTRDRMERYKEERRSTLRAKYKVENYRSEKQQSLPCDKPHEEDNSAHPGQAQTSISKHIVGASPSPDQIDLDKCEDSVVLRKLPVGNKTSSKQTSHVNNSQPQAKATNVSQAKSNADRKWSMQTGARQGRDQKDLSSHAQGTQLRKNSSSPKPKPTQSQYHNKINSKSTKQAQRSSYPPNGGQSDDDVNVKERAAFWNGSQKTCSVNNRNNAKDRKISAPEKIGTQCNPTQRKTSAPAYHHSSNKDPTNKQQRIKSLSMSSAPTSSVRTTQNKDNRSGYKQSKKEISLKDGNISDETCRQSPNIHLPSPNKIKNMAAFFEQNN